MNTARILDILPASAAATGGASPPAAARPQPEVAPVGRAPEGGGGSVPDSVRQRVAQEAKRVDVERRSLAEKIGENRRMTSRVGYFDGSTLVFVDLLDAGTQRALLRVFGPENPPPGLEDPAPAQASEAYAAAMRRAEGESAARV